MTSVFLLMIGGLFILMILGMRLAFTLIGISFLAYIFYMDMPLWMLTQRFFAGINSFVLVAIPLFLLVGNIMNRGKITDKLLQLSYDLIGHIRGGLALVNVLVSMLFGGVSGSAVADVTGLGSILIPAMVKKGYTPSFATAVTATTSTIGQIIPPSIIMIIYAASSGTSVAALFLAGAVPGLLITLFLMILCYIYAVKYNFPKEKRRPLKEVFSIIKSTFPTFGAPVIIIGGIVMGVFTATEASVIAVLYCLFLTMCIYKTLSWKNLPALMIDTAITTGVTLFCIGAAGIFGWLLSLYEIDKLFLSLMGDFIGSRMSFLLFVFVLFLLLGTFMDATPAIFLFVPLIVLAAASLDISMVHLGVIICSILAVGLVTPPYGLCLLLGASIADIKPQQAFKDVFIFLAVVFSVIAALIILPELALYLPRLIVPEFIN